jgi:sialate O-acetylesterase
MTEEFQIALIFQDGMVLQRDKKISLWGSGPDDEVVTVRIQNRQARAVVQKKKWMVILPPLETSESETLELSCGNRRIVLQNIAVGEVWIAGGQSNMEFFVRYDEEAENILQRDENRNIRFFDYPELAYPGQREERDYSRYGVWRVCNASHLEYFSAVGYHFADRLHRDLGVPVGIVGCNWGGTPACAWMDTDYLADNDGKIWIEEFNNATAGLDRELYLEKYRSDAGNFRNDIFSDKKGEALMFGMSREDQLAFMESPDFSEEINPGPFDKCRPGGLYESMVREVAPYSARGVLWYQGESDDKHPEIYRTVLSSLIRCWRDSWNEDLPFLFVQLAPFKEWLKCYGETYPILREEQEQVAGHVQDVWMASIMDAGEEWDIHPRKKKPVGERLALLAEGKVYGRDILCESPVFTDYTLEPGRLTLSFCHAEGGLSIKGESRHISGTSCSRRRSS